MALVMATLIRARGVCVDVGANRGQHLQRMIELAPDGQHIAVEALPDLARELTRRFPQVTVHEVAASSVNGTASFTQVIGREGFSSLRGFAQPGAETVSIEVATRRLDDLIPESAAPDFIKIDVEGVEWEVLDGARRLLEQHHPAVWFEHGRELGGLRDSKSGEIWDLLTSFGYRIFDADGHGPLGRRAFRGVPGDAAMWNWLAV